MTHLCTEMGLHCNIVDKVLCTVDAVELGEARLVQIHLLIDQLNRFLLNVLVDLRWEILSFEIIPLSSAVNYLIQVPFATTCAPSPLQVGVSRMVLLASLWLSHFRLAVFL